MSDTQHLNDLDRSADVGLNPLVPSLEAGPQSMFHSAAAGMGAPGLKSKLARRLARKAQDSHGPLGLPPMAYGLSSYNFAPARKAVSLSPIESFTEGAGQVAGQLAADHGAPVQLHSASDVAEGGFRGAAQEIPHRKEMESSFGMDFGHVQAYTDSSAGKANDSLNAHAYAMGNQVAFKSANPDKSLVAHELTHVVQQSGGVSAKADGGGIDTSGEAEAEAVESAVASGKPASSVLRSSSGRGGPAFKKAPARAEDSKFGMGLNFSMEGFEKSYSYTIWKGHYAWPIGIPGVNFVIDPNVKVGLTGGAKWGGKEKGSVYAQLGVSGECGIGLSGGIPDVAEVYGTINPAVEGVFKITKFAEGGGAEGGGEGGHAEGAQAAAPAHAASTWSLEGSIGIKAAAKIGVSLAGGIVDNSFELGSVEIGKLTGIYFDQSGFRSDKVGWEWGEKIKQTFEGIKKAIEKAKNMGKAAIQAAKDAGGAIARGAKDVWSWATSW